MVKICYVVTIPLTIRSFFIPQLKYLAEKGFDVSVICSDDGKIKKELGDTIKFIPMNIPRGISVGGSLKAIASLVRVFRKEQFDLIQYSTPNAAFYASIAAKMVGCKVRNYHLMGFRYFGASGIGRQILRAIERFACDNSTHIECVSRSNLEIGITDGLFKEGKATVVWNGSSGGVDLEKFDYSKRKDWGSQIREEVGYGMDDFVYGFVGRITRDKGINELLEAFMNLGAKSKLLLVGPMEGVDTLDSSIFEKAKNHSDIVFHDTVNDIERYYAAIDVLVLPSFREGFGNVVIEAAAMGTPAIVSRIPGPIDTIEEGKTALTVKVKDVSDLREKMEQIQEMDFAVMGCNAAEFVAKSFAGDKLCEKILERKKLLLGLNQQ